MKIGILTGGGDCPGLNAVIRAAAKSALKKGWEVIGFKDGYKGLIENKFIKLKDKDVSGVITKGGTILGTSNKANPFEYTLKPFGTSAAPRDMSSKAIANFRKHKLSALITIGGDGSLILADKFHKKGLPVIGVPKTIDNDLSATDLTFGFGSALSVATDAIDRLHTTAESHHRILIVETMGRYAGWIALRAGIAGGGDIILIPEIPYKNEDIVKAIKNRRKLGKHFSIVVVAEGAKPANGKMTVKKLIEGSPEPIRLGGISYKIAEMLNKEVKLESRVVVLGHLQRGGIPTAFDRWLATGFGIKAVEMAGNKKFGRMASFRKFQFTDVKIKDAIKKLKRVSPKSHEIKMAVNVGMSFGNTEITG
ncbi:MAG: ATP-dependent 6-phosphofructokinase [Elusimicrobiota bacterium]|nr:ATP-dependent 6-phosphofructokinase [Elusimicrobiota bacterium]